MEDLFYLRPMVDEHMREIAALVEAQHLLRGDFVNARAETLQAILDIRETMVASFARIEERMDYGSHKSHWQIMTIAAISTAAFILSIIGL